MPVTAVGVVPEKELTGSFLIYWWLAIKRRSSYSSFLYVLNLFLFLICFVGMFKHYLITRLSEQDEDLRMRYVANEEIFALVLGIVPESQANVRESLSYTAYENMLKNILHYKESVEPQDLQQFVILKDSLQLGQCFRDSAVSHENFRVIDLNRFVSDPIKLFHP